MEQTNLRSYKGTQPTIGKNTYIDKSAVLIGDITIGQDSSIWPLVAGRGDVNKMTIGSRTNIQDGTILHLTRTSNAHPNGFPLVIGDDVTIGHQCMLHGCTIGNRVLVGMGAIVMDGAIVEDDVFIGAGTVVPPNKTLRSGYLYVGNPMKEARPLKDAEIAFLKESAINYVDLKNDYLTEQ
ncbi:gamma carbonic anhydrase family protein [Thalassotalea insulae]|uniref:Gamma carbonic anhydrase family protein n=1 Tax=Thalassotalea insulae TaxID=2056778 RepID=A0ABQ6GT49_9GAMM|nr:gamma carbonic anhydrase family protein [Thalassotalea insulae]GLX78532.1 gamma carbonic anhydrase family protein [Thalassotalea insulae]